VEGRELMAGQGREGKVKKAEIPQFDQIMKCGASYTYAPCLSVQIFHTRVDPWYTALCQISPCSAYTVVP